jgi:hypothetical protein
MSGVTVTEISRRIVIVAVALSACGGRSHPPPAVALVDTVYAATEDGPEDWWLHRIEVRFGAFTDTLPDVLTLSLPVVTRDGEVTGIAWGNWGPTNGFFYDPGTEHLAPVPLPEPLLAYALSPDGRHIAYTTTRADGVVAVVRTWPGGDIVTEGTPADGYPSGVTYDLVEWLDAQRFRISQRLDHFGMGVPGDYRTVVYQRTSGSVRRGGVQTDTTTVTES